jgi:two-component system, NarL family, sensor kinase
VTRYRQPGLSITLNAPERLPPLPAAAEAAIYRIAQEALTNMARHAHAKHCVLTLEVDNDACLEVRDDGQGLPAICRAGVGLTSMCERAAELGGTCAIGPVEACGNSRLLPGFIARRIIMLARAGRIQPEHPREALF